MIVRALDANHDWTFGKGKNDYLIQSRAIVQCIETRLLSFLGDCFFDITAGIDWFEYLGSKNLLKLQLAVNTCILNTEGVTALNKMDIYTDRTTRKIYMTYSVNTIYTTNVTATSVINI